MSYPAETHGGTVTSWIPLTTLYSPSAECSSYFRLEAPSLVAFDPGAGLVDPNIRCQPSAVTTWWNQAALGVGNTAVSLLPMTCPEGWSTVETSMLNGVSTLAMCCPSEYSLTNQVAGSSGVNGNCASDVSPGQVLTFASTGENTNDWVTATTTIGYKSYVGAIAVVGWNVEQTSIISPSTTGSTLTSSPITTGSMSTSSPITTGSLNSLKTSASTPNAVSTSAAPISSDELSTGAKAGIGLGAGLGVIGVIALVVAIWIVLKRRNTSSSAEPTTGAFAPYNQDLIDFQEPPKQQQDVQSSLDEYGGVHELPHEERPPGELPAVQSPIELDANRDKFSR